jgi:hypothetical protein
MWNNGPECDGNKLMNNNNKMKLEGCNANRTRRAAAARLRTMEKGGNNAFWFDWVSG